MSPHPVFDVRSEEGTKRSQNILHIVGFQSPLYMSTGRRFYIVTATGGTMTTTLEKKKQVIIFPIHMINNPWMRDDA